jgi:hypothetical protein
MQAATCRQILVQVPNIKYVQPFSGSYKLTDRQTDRDGEAYNRNFTISLRLHLKYEYLYC